LVEEQLTIAGAVALGADVVQALEQRDQPVEVFQTDDVTLAQLVGSACGHATQHAQKPCRAQGEPARKLRT